MGDAEYAELMRIAIKMRQALALMCDGTYDCTCTICRAAWDFDHKILEGKNELAREEEASDAEDGEGEGE